MSSDLLVLLYYVIIMYFIFHEEINYHVAFIMTIPFIIISTKRITKHFNKVK